MHLLQPSQCQCYDLQLPSLSISEETQLDETSKLKFKLDCRTGAAVELSRSDVFVHGGLTIPLELVEISLASVQKEIIMYFAKKVKTTFKSLNDWMSSEIFYLDLITRSWSRIETSINISTINSITRKKKYEGQILYKFNNKMIIRERFLHAMCFSVNSLYIFGGLIVCPNSDYELVPTNALWKLDLETKEWSLISMDSRVSERFGHSMHVKSSDNESTDIRLIITGGVDKNDQKIDTVDIFNITHNCWEIDLTQKTEYSAKMNANGKPLPVSSIDGFTLLIQKNEANVPTLLVYTPDGPEELKNDKDIINNPPGPPVEVRISYKAPLIALPLKPHSKGIRLTSTSHKSSNAIEISHNLKYPTGDLFGNSILAVGFYPTGKPDNFHCYSFDVSTGKCSEHSINCSDYSKNKHRFWKIFIWQSHFQAVLLGTKVDDDCLPTVQKFDLISLFPLSMIAHTPNYSPETQQPISILTKTQSNETTKENSNSNSPDSAEMINELNFAAPPTSQFENYIQYIYSSKDVAPIRTVFPSYAMVLGKDAWEIFGGSLADFEIITDEGDSIGVPMYLLRKRWGRYFNFLLAQGYAKACADYDSSALQYAAKENNYSPNTSPAVQPKHPGLSKKSLDLSTVPSMSSIYRKQNIPEIHLATPPMKNSQSNLTSFSIPEDDEKPLAHIVGYRDEDEEVTQAQKKGTPYSTGKSNIQTPHDTQSVTSSSNGMVFRVPFKESHSPQIIQNVYSEKHNFNNHEKRRSSLAVMTPAGLQKDKNTEAVRRASHPNPSPAGYDDVRNHLALRFASSAHNSRKASVASQGSVISFVSSTSDRNGNSLHPPNTTSSNNSPVLGILNIVLPPQQDIPNEPLPSVPHDTPSFFSRRRSSFAEFINSGRSSPLSSRRSSADRCLSLPELKKPEDVSTSPYRPRIDKDQESDCSPNSTPLNRRSSSTRTSVATNSRHNSLSKISSRLEKCHSSATDNSENGISNFILDFEPLLTPRSLYMPWSTDTVNAFVEFFFTGQVNGKWQLAPVVLNLLVMSKIYEVTLLSTLVTEALFAIIARKEESLFVTCDALIKKFHDKISRYFNDDISNMNNNLMGISTYCELLKVVDLLFDVNNGFFDAELIQSAKGYCGSTTESSDYDVLDKLSPRPSTSPQLNSSVPTVYAGGPRNSHNSIGSINFPSMSTRDSFGLNSKVKKKSSLNREIDFSEVTKYSVSSLDAENMREDSKETSKNINQFEQDETKMSDKTTKVQSSYPAAVSASQSRKTSILLENGTISQGEDIPHDIKEQLEQAKLRNLSELDDIYEKPNTGRSVYMGDDEVSSSQSDSDEFESELGVLSINKMKRKIGESKNMDEYVDPLFKIGSNNTGSAKGTNTKGSGGTRNSRDEIPHLDLNIPTIENLTSSNSLPPVDYVIKSIYRTAVLVNDVKLMIRCLNAIEISKMLKAIKKKIPADIAELEEGMKTWDTSIFDKKNTSFTKLRHPSNSKSISPKTSTVNFAMIPSVSPADMTRKSSIRNLQQSSPKNKLFERSTKSFSQGKKPMKNTRHNTVQGSIPATSTSVLMNPGVMPPPPPSSNPKNRKDGSKNSNSFSTFFSKKKG